MRSDQFELFCLDGSRKPIDQYQYCNWGRIPSVAVVTSSVTTTDKRILYQRFLEKSARLFGKPESNNSSSSSEYNTRFEGKRDYYENGQDPNDPYSNQFGRNNQYNNNNNNNNYGSNDLENNYNNNSNIWNNSGRGGSRYSNAVSPLIEPIEKFYLFESTSRFGSHHNLMFSVSTNILQKLKNI